MEDQEIYLLFLRALESPSQNDEGVRGVFAALIKTTLAYRDQMKADGVTITVADVRTALDWLISSLNTGRLPETGDRIKLDLLKIWLNELNPDTRNLLATP